MVNNPPTQKIISSITAAQSLVVLVVSDSENVAKRIESHMRNAGHPVRAAWVTDLEDIEEALSRGTPDLLLCADNLPAAPLKDVIALCNRLCPDLPVLLLSTRYSPDETLAALSAGARDQVAHDDLRQLRHLELVLLREFVNHHHFRELTNTRLRLRDFESRHLQLLAGTNDAVAHIKEGILSHVNPSFAALLGYEKLEDLDGMPLMDLVIAENVPKAKEHLKQLNKGKVDGKPMECGLKKADGATVQITAQLTRGSVDGEDFIEMLIRAEAAVVKAAPVAHTAGGASGRLGFMDGLAKVLDAPVGKGVNAVLFFVLDDYTALEERLGLRDAEEAVVKLMDWIRQRLAPGESLHRFSTGELAALVHRNVVADVEQLADRLCKEIVNQIFATHGHEAQLTLSIGAYPVAGGETAAAVYGELARETRKLSTRSGGRQHAVLGPTAKSSNVEREEARRAAQIKRAIEENRLKLAYQSIASLEGDTRQHFDVLVRMMDEGGKEVHAGEFIKAAEKFGLMRTIDRWVTARVLKLLAKRDGAKDTSSLFIKLSEDTLKDSDAYLAWITEQLKARPLKKDELIFELQEITLQNHIRKAKALTQALVGLGATVCIEHFGIGANTQQLIGHIDASHYKFHPDYTHKFNDKDIQRKMALLMDVAKQKQIKTIVCHVEDANVMARLWQMGVNYIQGYHVQEPEVVLLSAEVFGAQTVR